MQIRTLQLVPSLIIGAILLSLISIPLYAQEVEQVETVEEETPEADQPKRNRESAEERKAERQAELQLIKDEAREARVAGRCTGAQNKLQARVNALEQILTNRARVYDGLSTKVAELADRLDATGADTTALRAQSVEMDTLIDSFYAVFGDYQLAYQDLATIDCTADVDAFLLALEDAKLLTEDVKAAAKSIREFFTGSILKTMQDIKATLNTTNEDSSSDDES